MPDLRHLIEAVEAEGELLRVQRTVEPRFELPALLKQAEARRKGIVFESVAGSKFPVAAALLTSTQRFALALNLPDHEQHDTAAHREYIFNSMDNPVACVQADQPVCKQTVLTGAQVDLSQLPVPTFFEHDSGPFLTAAVGISRNPDNGVINAGIYRVLITGKNELAVSVGPSSDLLKFLAADKAAGRVTQIALVIGASPALLMASSAKVIPEESELDVAGAIAGSPLAVTDAEALDLPVPADAEFILEVEIDHQRHVPNTMGEFGDLYGTQNGHIGTVVALTHRTDPVFHTVMAGAGKEHNALGFIILYDVEPRLREALRETCPQVSDLRVVYDPPSMGMPGELYVQLQRDSGVDTQQLARDIFALKCGRWDIPRVVRRIVILDPDIDLDSRRDISWAVNNRALSRDRHMFFDDLPLPGVGLRMAVDTTVPAAEREALQRLVIPGSENIDLDDYLD